MDVNDLSTVNTVGLVDVSGKELIPAEYASISVINDNYAKASKATGTTKTKDECLIYSTDRIASLDVDEKKDIMFTGTWCVYDLRTGKTVPGATGTKAYNISANGHYVTYYTDDKKEITVDETGKELSGDVDFFENGCYQMEDGDSVKVYDVDDKLLFSYSQETDYFINSTSGDYFLASKYESGGNTKYFCIDMSGKTVSSPMPEYISDAFGNLIMCDGKVYDFKGTQAVDGEYTSVYASDYINNVYMLFKDDTGTLVDADGNIIYSNSGDSTAKVDTSYMVAYKESGDTKKYYSFKDKDYTIEAYGGLCDFVVEAEKGDENCVIDTISGNTIIDGYSGYYSGGNADNGIFVYASTYEEPFHIYQIK